jgi:SMI1/KNR4 family protein SUKH-1
MSQLKYHSVAIALLPNPPKFSESAAKAVREREEQLGIRFPESVREWYSLEDAVGILGSYSNDDCPVKMALLGEPFDNWYDGGPRDFLSDNLLVFMHENQGVCNWAIKLNDNPDPPVVVEVDTAPNDEWLACADSFSTFIWCQIWDRIGPETVGVFAQEVELSAKDLDFLKSSFRQLPTTRGWPGRSNYRFEDEEGKIIIWAGEDRGGADWHIYARTVHGLKRLLEKIWHCGRLPESLYGDEEGEKVLMELRSLFQ